MNPESGRASLEVVTSEATGHDTAEGLRATIDLAPIGLAQFDLAGRFLHVNDRLCDILGCSRQDLLARTFQEITFPDDLPHCLELTARVASGAVPNYCVDKRFVRSGGSIVWTRITVSAVRGPGGEVTFFIGAAEDITAQVVAAEALRTAEERLRTALDASMIGTFRFDIRRNALDWADGLDRVFGCSDPETLEEFLSVMHPDDRAHLLAAYTRSATEGTDLEEEFRVIWPDGSIHWLHDRGRTFKGDDGQPLCIIGALTDISNHKRMGAVIAEREAQFRTLANTIPQLAWIADNDGSRTWFNDRWSEYTGRQTDEMLGFGWMEAHSPEVANDVLDAQRRAFAEGVNWEDTVRLRRHDGEYRWFLARAMPVRGQDGRIIQWFGTNTDITAQKLAGEELQEVLGREYAARRDAERATAVRQQVLGFVAHDLRNPLQAIVMASSAILDLPLPPEQQARRAQIIKRCAREMDRLIADLLDVSRIEAGTFAVRHESVEIAPLVEDILERCRESADQQQVRLEGTVDPKVSRIQGDEQRLGQALTNLVSNAIKFTPSGGCVRLEVRQDPTHVEITVTDTGCGIPPENLPLIFERFWQANRTAGGAGLGLAIVKGIVESHNGEISVESRPGHGTIFRLRLPS